MYGLLQDDGALTIIQTNTLVLRILLLLYWRAETHVLIQLCILFFNLNNSFQKYIIIKNI